MSTKPGSYPHPIQTIRPPVEHAQHDWHVLVNADGHRFRLKFNRDRDMWSTDTAQVITAEAAYRLAWRYVGPARG